MRKALTWGLQLGAHQAYSSRLHCQQVYISEIAYPEVRGLLGSCVQLMVVTGILLAYLAGRVFT